MKKYKAILWDLDQTLLDFNKSQTYALKYTFDKLNTPLDAQMIELYAGINESYWKRYERGEVTKDEVQLGRFITLLDDLGITHIKPKDIQEIYQDALGSVFYFLEESNQLVTMIKEKGFRQYVVTNGVNKTQGSKMKLSGLDKLVDGAFISEQVGYPKPHKAFFDVCFTHLANSDGIERKECVLVGDSLTSDMKGGMTVGIDTCWYNPEGLVNTSGIKVTYEIKSLWELPGILGVEI